MTQKNPTHGTAWTATLGLYTVLVLSAIFLPIILSRLNLYIIGTTYDGSYKVFELFGFCASVALIAVTYIELKKRSGEPFEKLLLVILPALVSFNFLFFITENSYESRDYYAYKLATNAIIEGTNPYIETGHAYVYPPLQAQVMALLYQLIERGALLLSKDSNVQEFTWNTVFYFYQCTQFLLVILTYFLCYYFARNTGLKSIPASVLVAALLLFNNPLLRTLKFNQVNLWLLASFLLAILLLQRYPLLSGFAVAVGGHIKLYPLILLLPWGITKQWRAVVATLVSFFGIILIQTNWGREWELWYQFLTYFRSVQKPTEFRNNSLYNIFYHLSKMTGGTVYLGELFLAVAMFAVAVWFVIRFIKREKAYFALVKNADLQASSSVENITFRLYGHSIDALALGLLISPSVWEHHYVLAIPIAIWAVATRGYDKPWHVGIGTFLMLALPIFDVFPFSYHRILGLLMLLYITSPERFPTLARIQKERLFLS